MVKWWESATRVTYDREVLALPTEGHCAVGHQDDDEGADEEVHHAVSEADHVVSDGDEGEGVDHVEGQLRHHLGEEVHVGAIHAVEVLAEEERKLGAERLEGEQSHGNNMELEIHEN